MKRFLFVVPPFAGHVNPTIGVARELVEQGNEVAWVGYANGVKHLLPPDAKLIPIETRTVNAEEFNATAERARQVRGFASFEFFWESVLTPLAHGMLDGVLRAVDSFRPDVIVCDHQALAGGFAARRTKVPWATFCTTSASLVDTFADLPRVKEWVDGKLNDLQTWAGLDQLPAGDLSPELIVVFSTSALIGDISSFPKQCEFVGPSIADRPDETPFPWDALQDKKRVLISLGTVPNESSVAFFRAVTDAFTDSPHQFIVVAPEGAIPSPPPNFIVQQRVPQLRLLPHVQAVMCHGGHNTVCEALANGLPLVVTPIRDDQPVIANQVAMSGAGLRLKFARTTGDSLRAALGRIIDEPSFAQAAERIRESFAAAGGAKRAAELLINLR